MKPKVLITYNIFGDLYREILKDFEVTMPAPGVESFTYDEVLAIVSDYDAILSMWNFPIDKRLIEHAAKLKIVSNFAVGYDNIDIASCTAHNVAVANTPDPVTEPTADIALGLMIDVMRGITSFDKQQHQGNYVKGIMKNLGASLYGKTLGIYGMGRIGSAVARRAQACGMKVLYHNRNRLSTAIEQQMDVRYVTLDELFSQSDVLSLNAPLTPQTHHVVNNATLSLMKPSAYIINTARGALIDESALISALERGQIAGAGLDVYEFNDTVSAQLLTMDNTVLTPHIGTQTVEGRREMAQFAATNIRNFFNGDKVARVN